MFGRKRNDLWGAGDHQMRLMDALNFTRAELTINRTGRLSHEQRSRLRHIRNMRVFSFVVSTLFLLPWIVLVFSAAFAQRSVFDFCIGSFLLLFYSNLSLPFLTMRARFNIRLVWISAEVVKVRRSSFRKYLQFGGIRFLVRRSAYNAFRLGERYALYYAPNTKTILSAEWLGDAKRKNDV